MPDTLQSGRDRETRGRAPDDPPRVSAIIIFLDAERFLAEAVESVLAQTYRHWELLLVDDGSQDRSTAIALEYTRRHPGVVRYLEHDGHRNRGMSASRNLGLRHAGGAYIGLLDADDVWLPRFLEQQVAIMEAHSGAGMVVSPVQWWRSWNPENGRADSIQGLGVESDVALPPPGLLPRFLRDERQVPGTCGLLARRSVVERVGGFEDAFRGMYEDQVFYAKMCVQGPVVVAREYGSRVRLRVDSCTAIASRTGQHDAAREAFLCWLAGYLRRGRIRDVETWAVLHHERVRLRWNRLVAPLRPIIHYGGHAWGMLKSTARPIVRAVRHPERSRSRDRTAAERLGADTR